MLARVTDLAYVALAIPDLEAERRFFGNTWGLVEIAEQHGKIYFAAEGSVHPFVIRLRQDDERKTDLIGFYAASRAEVDALHAQVGGFGVKMISPPASAEGPAGGYSFRFFDPDGRAVEVISDAKQRAPRVLEKGESIPVGLSHIVLHTPDLPKLQKFYEEALGFHLSDRIGEFMVFLRCNSAHHRLAILPGPPALNHIAFDVNTIDDLMRGLARMTDNGIQLQWGPGRHTAGNNTFSYYTTPNGNTVEYTSDLEMVDDATWQPTTYAFTPEITDQWGTGRIIPGTGSHAEMRPDAGLWKVPS